MRNAYELPPLPDGNPPVVLSTTGLGAAGGAYAVTQPNGSGYGYVEMVTGSNPSAGGNIYMTFPYGAGYQDVLYSWSPSSGDFGALTNLVVNVGGHLINQGCGWAGTLQANRRYRLFFEWNTVNV